MSNSTRKKLGVLALVIGILFFILVELSNSAAITGLTEWLLEIIAYTWFVSSGASKMMMVIGKRVKWINIVGLSSWVIMIFSILFCGFIGLAPHHEAPPRTLPEDIISFLCLLGWPFIDLIDLAYLTQLSSSTLKTE